MIKNITKIHETEIILHNGKKYKFNRIYFGNPRQYIFRNLEDIKDFLNISNMDANVDIIRSIDTGYLINMHEDDIVRIWDSEKSQFSRKRYTVGKPHYHSIEKGFEIPVYDSKGNRTILDECHRVKFVK